MNVANVPYQLLHRNIAPQNSKRMICPNIVKIGLSLKRYPQGVLLKNSLNNTSDITDTPKTQVQETRDLSQKV